MHAVTIPVTLTQEDYHTLYDCLDRDASGIIETLVRKYEETHIQGIEESAQLEADAVKAAGKDVREALYLETPVLTTWGSKSDESLGRTVIAIINRHVQ